MVKKAKPPKPGKAKKAAPKAPPAQAAPPGPGGSGKPKTISLCMMVKNEEHNLPRVLSSAAPYVDEIIVVDTGSTDRTMDIAREYGAKIYQHPWENSFSVHRNQSIGYATGDWLLILDADEELVAETAPLLRKLVDAPPSINAFFFQMFNNTTAGAETFILHPRMFRNHVGFRYRGKVHNRPLITGQLVQTGVKLIHYGYNDTPEVMEAKHQRRLTMIREWIKDEPENFQAHSYLAQTLISRPESRAEGAEEALTALNLLRQESDPDKARHYPHVYYGLLSALGNLQRDDELIEHARQCLKLVPHYPDSIFFLVEVYYRHRDWAQTAEYAERFIKLQDEAAEHPERFLFFENMTRDQMNFVLHRWVVADVHLGDMERAREMFRRSLDERRGQDGCRQTVQTLLVEEFADLAAEFAAEAGRIHSEWDWPAQLLKVAKGRMAAKQQAQGKKEALAKLKAGELDEAARLFGKAQELNPADAGALVALGEAYMQKGETASAEAWIMRGLNLHPGLPQGWKRLGEICFDRGDHAEAEAAYLRYLNQVNKDASVLGRLGVCQRRKDGQPPVVAQKPPRLLLFLVSGLSPEMVRQPAPHLLMGRAWGELVPEDGKAANAPNWASLFTGASPAAHGITSEGGWDNPVDFSHLKVPCFWEALPPETTVGLVAPPLGWPPPVVNGWALAGYPSGLLTPQSAQPSRLAVRALASGYRSDFLLSQMDEFTFSERLERDIRQEALLLQIERHKLSAAMAMPAVDVLVVGLTFLEYIQRVRDLAHYNTFSAYQQVYGWMESTLAALRPQAFAILSQRAYARSGRAPLGGGFYCLSWLRGENGRQPYVAVAPELVRFLGGDPARLGRAKG